MLGAIIGDTVGSVYEFNNIKTKEFPFFTSKNHLTDDSIMTLAVAKAVQEANTEDELSRLTVKYMQELGNKYPNAGYGGRFRLWLRTDNPQPYNSWGNGSAMRVSPCALKAKTLEAALQLSDIVTEVTHNHPEGIKGARATTAAIFLARTGHSKEEIKEHIENNYYKLNKSLDEIRLTYSFDVSCQGTVPQAIQAFLESESFEDAIRNAISIGGDSDTLAAITGAIAEQYYTIPKNIQDEIKSYMDKYQQEIVSNFYKSL
ncbi:MAG: ADP-ribosylglycohydrolase family protein [Oscillospiraceae bacterium]|nr:ADP-ribosylglycohydrolase family protein [Oscillospiraceae bacterium]